MSPMLKAPSWAMKKNAHNSTQICVQNRECGAPTPTITMYPKTIGGDDRWPTAAFALSLQDRAQGQCECLQAEGTGAEP